MARISLCRFSFAEFLNPNARLHTMPILANPTQFALDNRGFTSLALALNCEMELSAKARVAYLLTYGKVWRPLPMPGIELCMRANNSHAASTSAVTIAR